MTNQVTIFTVDVAWLGHAPGPMFGVRYGTQYLPKGVWVVGFLAVGDDGEIRELLSPGYIPTQAGQASYDACVRYARELLAGKWEGDEPYKGLVA
ncbi:MAG: hypothetical protein HYV77_01455 [Candidatus Wildermuthbacteria bacterium]|nr:hypothetical protein [Candidatus Wildermuthbacteria bacterium]